MTFSDWAVSPEDADGFHDGTWGHYHREKGARRHDTDPWSRMHREVLVRARWGLVGKQCLSGQNPTLYPMR